MLLTLCLWEETRRREFLLQVTQVKVRLHCRNSAAGKAQLSSVCMCNEGNVFIIVTNETLILRGTESKSTGSCKYKLLQRNAASLKGQNNNEQNSCDLTECQQTTGFIN